jgi:uncharacterized membrane protein HdeD (DUF308 family)
MAQSGDYDLTQDEDDLIRQQARDLARAWWLLVVLGVACIAGGIILLARPSHSLSVLAVVFGILVLIEGTIELIRSFGHGVSNRGLAAIVGVLGIVVGIVLVRHPTTAVSALGLLIGIWLVAAGAIRFVGSITWGGHRLLRAALAILEVVIGIVIVSDPHIGYTALAIILGIWLLILGAGSIALGILIRGAKSELSSPPQTAGAAT